MNKGLIISMLLAINSLHGMHQPDKGPAVLFETDSNGDVWFYDASGQRVKDQYDELYCSLDATRTKDDTKKQFSIPQPLFIQLLVQASKTKQTDTVPFHELLCKIRQGTISTNQPTIVITHKDAMHRLLSYIPQGTVHNLVNGKKVRMMQILGSRVKEVATHTPAQITANMPTIYDDPIDEYLFPAYSKGASSRGAERELTGEDSLSCNYDFLRDAAHHEKVVAEFTALIQGK